MKMRLLFALAALAIGLAVQAFALSGNLAEDVKAIDEIQRAEDESRGGIHQQRSRRFSRALRGGRALSGTGRGV